MKSTVYKIWQRLGGLEPALYDLRDKQHRGRTRHPVRPEEKIFAVVAEHGSRLIAGTVNHGAKVLGPLPHTVDFSRNINVCTAEATGPVAVEIQALAIGRKIRIIFVVLGVDCRPQPHGLRPSAKSLRHFGVHTGHRHVKPVHLGSAKRPIEYRYLIEHPMPELAAVLVSPAKVCRSSHAFNELSRSTLGELAIFVNIHRAAVVCHNNVGPRVLCKAPIVFVDPYIPVRFAAGGARPKPDRTSVVQLDGIKTVSVIQQKDASIIAQVQRL